MVERITSAQNPKIKELLALQEKSRERREKGLFVVEGRRELEHCLAAGFTVDTVFYCPAIYGAQLEAGGGCGLQGAESLTPSGECSPKSMAALASDTAVDKAAVGAALQAAFPEGTKSSAACNAVRTVAPPRIIEVTPELYGKIAYRGGTEGIVAEVRARNLMLEDLQLGPDPLIVVLESVEKPGNLGAVLRSADAAGADAVIVCDPLTDLFNPNLIRSSLGGIFTVPCVAVDSPSAIAWLKGHGIRILTAQLQDSVWYYDSDMKRGTAIVIGTESTGLTDIWREAADEHIRIPMLGRLDSLNASVSAAILLFEAVRQRNA